MMRLTAATRPTLYFIGVTTKQSSIMRVFPAWAQALGLGDVEIKGIDFKPHSDAEAYREAVAFIRDDPLSRGALVTTHKLDLFAACQDMFNFIDPHAALMSEVSSISKRGNVLRCHAKDPISSGLSIDALLPENHFSNTDAGLLSMGAGGSTIAITWHLMQQSRRTNRPRKIVITNRSQPRLDHIQAIHKKLTKDITIEYVLAKSASENDRELLNMPAHSFVINATGLGKDAPGSPLSHAAKFPTGAIAWDLNYRGDLVFLDQARKQQQTNSLQVEDGWTYFIHGWTQVIAEVFDIDIPTSGPMFEQLSHIAQSSRS